MPTCTRLDGVSFGISNLYWVCPPLRSRRSRLAYHSEIKLVVCDRCDRSRSIHHKSSDLFIMRVRPKPHYHVCRMTSSGKVSNHSLLPGAWPPVACWSVHCFALGSLHKAHQTPMEFPFWCLRRPRRIMDPTPPIDTDLHDGNASGHPSCPAESARALHSPWASMVANTTQVD